MMELPRLKSCLFMVLGLALLAACGERFSPDIYATRAVQQADKVEQGIIVGVRPVRVTAEGSTGAATGAAAGGVLGAQAPGGGIVSALGGVGGALVGGLLGKGAEHTIVDTGAFEYIVRTTRDELMRVTQQDREPLARGQRVLLITGTQARVVPDYTLAGPDAPALPPAQAGSQATAAPAGMTAPGGEARAAQPAPQAEADPPGQVVRAAEARPVIEPLPAATPAPEPPPPLPAYPPLPPAPRAVDSPVTGL
jgi:outer membrane lipoprotein SlyB